VVEVVSVTVVVETGTVVDVGKAVVETGTVVEVGGTRDELVVPGLHTGHASAGAAPTAAFNTVRAVITRSRIPELGAAVKPAGSPHAAAAGSVVVVGDGVVVVGDGVVTVVVVLASAAARRAQSTTFVVAATAGLSNSASTIDRRGW
jgi:hypothetical protein